MQYIEKDGLKGYINEEGAWINPPSPIEPTKKDFVEVTLKTCILSLSFDLQDDLILYAQANPLLGLVLDAGKLTESDIDKLEARILHDFSNQLLTEELKDAIVAALGNLRSRF